MQMKNQNPIKTKQRRAAFILLFLMMLVSSLFAQQRRTVTGTVTADRFPLAGASVYVRGERQVSVTDANGRYSVSVPPADTATLVFSFIGMKSVNVQVQNRSVINITMEETAEQIEAAVLTGYREISADSYTGSAAVISSKTISSRAIGTIEQALRGVATGALVAASGQPGEQNEVRLRGVGSMNAENQPLYVVDGVVWEQINQTGNDYAPSNPLNALNPSDIANITILKDAASAALYGSRGANGVIVITTKSGVESDKTNITFDVQTGVSQLRVFPQVVNGPQYAELWSEAQMHYLVQQQLAMNGITGRLGLAEELQRLYGDKNIYTFQGMNYNQWMKVAHKDFNALYAMPNSDGTYQNYDFFGADADKLPSTDWFDLISRVAPFMKFNLAMQGGNKSLRHYASMEYFDQQGAIINSQLKRYSARLKLTSASDRQMIHWEMNMSVAHSLQSGPQSGGQTYNTPQYAAVILPSVIPAFLEDGSYNFFFPANLLNSHHNPVASAYENINERPQTTINLQGKLTVNNLLSWLKFSSTNSLRYNLVRRHVYYNSEFGSGATSHGSLTERDSHNTKITSTNQFTANKVWRGRHRMTVIAGAELENQGNTYNQMSVSNFVSDKKPSSSMGSQIDSWEGGGYGYSLFSAFTQADYSYRYRYFFSGTYRMDASSRFGPDYRYGNFWSVSGAYRISNEPWFDRQFSKYISYLRFRGSYGVNGNIPTQYYQWRDAFQTTGYMGEGGAYQSYRPTVDLTWEGNRIWNVAMDLRMFDNRLKFTADYYQRKSSNLLQDVNVSLISGYRTMLMNTKAGIDNRGLEFELVATPLQNDKHTLDISFNFATLKSVYYGLQSQQLDGYSRQLMANGYSVNSWYLREYAGVSPSTGQVQYMCTDPNTKELYVDTATTNALYEIRGQGIPKVSGGFNLFYAYGPFSISALASYAWGYQIYDRLGANILSSNGSYDYSISIESYDRWNPDNPYGTMPLRLNNLSSATRYTYFLKKGDYLKIRNLKLQYTLPEGVSKALKLTSASIYVQAENPFIFSHIKGYDPELSISGYRFTDRYPSAATFIAGLTLNF